MRKDQKSVSFFPPFDKETEDTIRQAVEILNWPEANARNQRLSLHLGIETGEDFCARIRPELKEALESESASGEKVDEPAPTKSGHLMA